jgi:hypothetical protein
MIRSLQEIYESVSGSMKDYNAQSFETRSKAVEENLASSVKNVSKDILKDLEASKTSRTARREEFISFEMWKKTKGDKKIRYHNPYYTIILL